MINERELIQRAIRRTCAKAPRNLTQKAVVSRLFATNAEDSEKICWKYGFHPDKIANG